MFDNQNQPPVSPTNGFAPFSGGLPNTKTPPVISPQPTAGEPEDIFKNVDPAPASPTVAVPSPSPLPSTPIEPAIKSAPSIFSPSSTPRNIPPAPDVADLAGPGKTLDTKSIILLILIAVIVVGTVAGGIWWFLRYNKNKNINANNSPVANLFNGATNQTPQNPATDVNNTNTLANSNSNTNTLNSNLPPANPDTDGDGLTDEEEATLGTSLDASDTDNDGLSDREEVMVYKTDPLKADTDGDSQSDSEEIKAQTDPLKATATTSQYKNTAYGFAFTPLTDMVLISATDNVVVFNDDVNQIKFYIYLDNSQPDDLPSPDISYLVLADSDGLFYIKNQETLSDATPYSTELQTRRYESNNGRSYILRYVATKKADNHQSNFESLIRSFQILK